MSGKPYVAERQVEYWTSRAIEDFFLNAGYHCVAVPLTQRAERHLPADFLFEVGKTLKVFGLQYKVQYGPLAHWHLDAEQHQTLQHFPWISYALSEMQSAADYRNALHALRIKSNAFSFVDELPVHATNPYKRWWAFAAGLESCTEGALVRSVSDFMDMVTPALSATEAIADVERILDVFLLDITSRKSVRFGSGIRPNRALE